MPRKVITVTITVQENDVYTADDIVDQLEEQLRDSELPLLHISSSIELDPEQDD